jgi:hypothetical protein
LRFREDYGASQLEYPFSESAPFHAESAVDSFDALILRAGHNKSWSANWDREPTVFTRDQLGRDLQLAMSGIGSHGANGIHISINLGVIALNHRYRITAS